MKTTTSLLWSIAGCGGLLMAAMVQAQDWPQWRGLNRDARAADFKAPAAWPKELKAAWKVTVGEGVANPSLVGNRLYVIARQEGKEVMRCLDAATGKELWQDSYETQGATGPAAGFSGPRATPAVAEGKVVALGVRGILSCWDANTGKLLWRKEEFTGSLPRFFTSASPLLVDGLCVVQLGGGNQGGVLAYDLGTGQEKWRWTGDGAAYASPVLATVDGVKLVIAQTDTKMVALTLAEGKLVWETPFAVQGRGYNAVTPIVDGATVIFGGSGRGLTAVKLAKEGDKFTATELWKSPDINLQFNTPVLKNGWLYGISARNELFCASAKDGKVAWSVPFAGAAPAEAAPQPAAGGGGGGPGGGRGGRGGGMGGGGYGSVVDGGSVLLALTPAAELVVAEPNAQALKEVARIKLDAAQTYAYPVASGDRLFIKDRDSLALVTIK
ncbi:PQQ-like beta-propeller repeat protein [Fontisphaera persica]|uniref:PQQ-binding-like beta-propeller repeat protein n=1 Tax=Fontisphaera persica TaxID=2974023 RepID=UPI0024BFE3E9|nr:PQQ-binding-like beta-propeller repeat protein [Fontisphaera persica]WCJ59603.1 PQQ-like beta-propeller repeat protein [Fontisphaera persica]